jgi:hypothetical protein
MDLSHRRIIDIVTHIINGRSIKVIDFGCGNGALLNKIAAAGSIEPFGVDNDPVKIQHAKLLLPKFEKNFFLANMFDQQIRCVDNLKYDLAILSLGLIIQVNTDRRMWLKQTIEKNCIDLLVYVYDYWLDKYGSLQQMAEMLGIHLISTDKRATASLARSSYKEHY